MSSSLSGWPSFWKSALHEAVRRGELTADDARDRLGRDETYGAEYIALAKLQADALITLDEKLARAAREIVRTATRDDLRA